MKKRIVKLSDRTHVLKRPGRYIGAVTPTQFHRPVLENEKIIFKDIEYVPALIKIIREIIDNSVDNAIKTDFKFANKINIKMDESKIVIEDNGTGIPVHYIHDEHGNVIEKYAPEAVWTELKTGENFDDESSNTSIGQNGEGSTLTNIFSIKFIGETDDGEKYFKLSCKNNMQEIDSKIEPSKGNRGTKVTFWPDLEKLHLGSKIDPIYHDLLKFELLFLAATYPKIDFWFNGKKIKTKTFRQIFNEYFDDKIVFDETDNIVIGFAPSEDGYQFIHFINGINVFNGGRVLDNIENKIIGALTEKIQKRHPEIKKNDIKNKVTFFAIINNMPNPRFADQIKSECINLPNQYPEIQNEINELSKSKFIDKVYKTKEIISPIVDLFKAKMALKDKKDLEKAVKKIKPPAKYWKPSKEKKYFIISEGDSAIGSIINGVGRDYYGFLPIRGKIPNVIKDEKAIKKHKELLEIAQILGVDFKSDKETLDYENIVIATDMDVDGNHIATLMLGYLYLIAPEYLKQGKVFRFLTPLLISYKGSKIHKIYFDFEDLQKAVETGELKNVTLDYKKGLGSLSEEEWDYLFNNYKFEDLLLPLQAKDDNDFKELLLWLGEEREHRKKMIKTYLKDFDINFV